MEPKDKNSSTKGIRLIGLSWNGTSSGIGQVIAWTQHGKLKCFHAGKASSHVANRKRTCTFGDFSCPK